MKTKDIWEKREHNNIKIKRDYGLFLMKKYDLSHSAVKSLIEKRQSEMMLALEKDLVEERGA